MIDNKSVLSLAINNARRTRTRLEQIEEWRRGVSKKGIAFVRLSATYRDSRNAHFTICTKRDTRSVPSLPDPHARVLVTANTIWKAASSVLPMSPSPDDDDNDDKHEHHDDSDNAELCKCRKGY
ncbi:hypothetical protein P5V15_002071 [Pogonomyrmex californicus]